MITSIRFAFHLLPALLLLVQDVAAQQATCALDVELKDDGTFTPPGWSNVARFIPQDDFNSYYDCLHLGSSYPGGPLANPSTSYYRKLVLSQLNLVDRLFITAVKMNSDLGNKMTQKLGTSYNFDTPVLVLQAGGIKLEDSDIDGSNNMRQLFNRASSNGISFFMVIHGVDFIRTGGLSGATTRLRAFSTDLRLAADGNEWVATGGALDSHIDIQAGNTKKILATYWDKMGFTYVNDFDLSRDTFICNGFARDDMTNGQKKVSTCACAMAFSESAATFVGARKRIVHVPTSNGCHEFTVKANSNIANSGGLPVQINDFSVDCSSLNNNKEQQINALIQGCGGGLAYDD